MPRRRIGRPRKIESDAHLRRVIQAYFDRCEEGRTVPIITRKGIVGETIQTFPLSIEGILGDLGVDWHTWDRYCHDEDFRLTTAWARARVRSDIVRRGQEGHQPPGVVQLLLRAMDRDRYADRKVVDVTADVTTQAKDATVLGISELTAIAQGEDGTKLEGADDA